MLESYRLYSKLRVFRYRVERARHIIRNALEISRKPYVACSWGKDSICLLHLVVQARPDVDVIWVQTDQYDDWPGTHELLAIYEQRYRDVKIHIVKAMGITECYRLAGGFYAYADTPEKRKIDIQYEKSFFEAITEKARSLNCDLAFIGLREDESNQRRLLLRTRGELFFSKQRNIWQCYPLSHWSAKDIWAFIAAEKLPYLELYDLAEDRERARNGTMFAANFIDRGGALYYSGQLTLLKKMYPELFNRFAAEFPEVRCYV